MQLAPRSGERDRRLASGRTAAPLLVACPLDQTLELVGVLGAPLARLLGRDLKRDRKKLLHVTVDMRIKESEKVFSRHARLLSFPQGFHIRRDRA